MRRTKQNKNLSCVEYAATDLNINPDKMDLEGCRVVRTLISKGYQAYFVGGCVRDIMLGKAPKDFDVATDARPEVVKEIFHARIIGRRFKIVHVRTSYGIVEVSTFRMDSTHKKNHRKTKRVFKKKIATDNVYGLSIEHDVMRRDFTANALYYDLTRGVIIDFVGGVDDIKKRRLKCIGSPDRRLAEDPARILRAIRFKEKLGFNLDSKLQAAIVSKKTALTQVNPSRLYSESIKLFFSGVALHIWEKLKDDKIIDIIFPRQAKLLAADKTIDNFFCNAINLTDNRVNSGALSSQHYLYAILFWPVFVEYQSTNKSHSNEFMAHICEHLLSNEIKDSPIEIPRFVRTTITEIWLLQSKLDKRPPNQILTLLDHPKFRPAYHLLSLRSRHGYASASIASWWLKLQYSNNKVKNMMIQALKTNRGIDSSTAKIDDFSKPRHTMAQFFQIHTDNPQKRLLKQTAEILWDGGVIVYPTDSGYALGCVMGCKHAMDRIRNIRKLDSTHDCSLVGRSISSVSHYANIDSHTYRLMKRLTPGAYTFVLPATKELPRRLHTPKKKTVGIRIPNTKLTLQLLDILEEPLVSTTLLWPDGDTIDSYHPEEIRNRLQNEADLIIDVGVLTPSPTTVLDCTTPGKPAVVRVGSMPVDFL